MTPRATPGRLVRPRIAPRALRSPRVSPAHRGAGGATPAAPIDAPPDRPRRRKGPPIHEQQGRQPASPIKEVTWEWYVPIYFWLGGIAAGSWVAAAAEDLAGERDRHVVRAGRYLAAGSMLGGTALLILDLGRPDRFLNMLRIVRTRSTMSLGSWGLAQFGAFTGAVALLQAAEDGLLGSHPRLGALSRGWLGRAAHVAGLPAALFVGSYTGVLLASTSTPSWARRARILGPLFLASGMSSGFAAVSGVVELTSGATGSTRRRLARAESVTLAAELMLGAMSASRAASLPSARREARGWRLLRRAMFGAGIAAPLLIQVGKSLAPRALAPGMANRRRQRRRDRRASQSRRLWLRTGSRSGSGLVGAALTLAGSLALRYVITHEGRQSARTPDDTWAFTAMRGRDGPVSFDRGTQIASEITRRPARRHRELRGRVTGRVTVAQEDRIRVVSQSGRGYLFTVKKRRASLRTLERWRDEGTTVRVHYRGVPDAGAIVERIGPA